MFGQFHLKMHDILVESHFRTGRQVNDIYYLSAMDDNKTMKPPFYLSYQTADIICFTRNPTDALTVIRQSDLVTFNQIIFKSFLKKVVHPIHAKVFS